MQIEALRRSTRVEQTPWNIGLTLKVELFGGMIGTEASNAGRSFGNAGPGGLENRLFLIQMPSSIPGICEVHRL